MLRRRPAVCRAFSGDDACHQHAVKIQTVPIAETAPSPATADPGVISQLPHFKAFLQDLPGSPVVRTPSFHCRGLGFHPWGGGNTPQAAALKTGGFL